ncbi:N-acetylmuramate alpha-1-phosphate uridylyltransferase MurU [Aliiglaciecola sp. LCG003]|uniref:N-acetylmuramate alpha-1-phosphate uridylyltransferase MurU n=1 Tax=Aliiglaciecola sp. LCG003 TaxID=3053655 RepID=UPI0025735F59|nr:nucleotidyltransferase family protein [Aliiglaciecola sp. LCG003]WJG11255.1 nucleotidyltransferase family protein [Aliiglaciecola sp. LCG003]
MLLAAGRGERMRPLTDVTPKPLLKINHKALIDYHLERLAQAGFEQVIINHAWLGEQIVDYLKDGSQFGLQIVYSKEQQALETAGGIVHALPLIEQALAGSKQFLVISADVFTDIDFATLPELTASNLAHLIMVNNPPHNLDGDFCLRGQQIYRQAQNQYTFSGVAIYHTDMFKNLTAGKLPLRALLFEQIANNRVSGQRHQGYWHDVGTAQRLQQLNAMEQI